MEVFNRSLFGLFFKFSRRNFLLDDIGIFLAKYLPYLLVLGFLILVFSDRSSRKRIAIFCEGALSVILARGLVTEVIRFFYRHPRPFDALGFSPLISDHGYSFPSGHAATFFALAVVAFYINRKAGIWFFILAAINGLARIFVGVHWPLDIGGGIIVGLLCGFAVHKLLEPYTKNIQAS